MPPSDTAVSLLAGVQTPVLQVLLTKWYVRAMLWATTMGCLQRALHALHASHTGVHGWDRRGQPAASAGLLRLCLPGLSLTADTSTHTLLTTP